ncbi:MAG: acetamidase/formamidase family protein [Anaerolineae bacterium]|nr:acetamidase/formamidase family protein [Thermoflexales bacterium]MDW8407690.1 acetamidase/formamidase family protein [Anaerolineae bacterium]
MTVHYFKPTLYHTTLGAHEPVLRITDGDSVVTTTLDAGGCDERGEQVGPRPNPQTGPFYVEGAEPGDTLAITFDHLWPNRDYGYTSTVIATNVVDPDFARELPPRERAEWSIDRARGIARLIKPETALGAFTLPLDPMLGCFGVAPANGEAIHTSTAGRHGGNMDYRGFRNGVTAYLPVAAPGALVFVGDGHAVQGDGEMAGTGIETSFEVRFTVRLLKGRKINWPRGEDETFIFTVGNARPLDQATQHATTEMMRWLMSDYGMDWVSASTLLGQCVRYELGNMYDPAYTMVCKLPKALLVSR